MPDFVTHLPPPHTLARHNANLEFAAALRQTPNTWARYPYTLTRPSGFRYRIRHGKDAAFRVGFDAEVRGGDIYISYVSDALAEVSA